MDVKCKLRYGTRLRLPDISPESLLVRNNLSDALIVFKLIMSFLAASDPTMPHKEAFFSFVQSNLLQPVSLYVETHSTYGNAFGEMRLLIE